MKKFLITSALLFSLPIFLFSQSIGDNPTLVEEGSYEQFYNPPRATANYNNVEAQLQINVVNSRSAIQAVEIYSIGGELMNTLFQHQGTTSGTANVATLQSGSYSVVVILDDRIVSTNFIKN